MKFCTNSARLMRKLDHVLLWIPSNENKLLQYSLCADQRKFQWQAMFCLYTLPLARPAQAKIQMLTAICSIVKLIPWTKVNLSHLYRLSDTRSDILWEWGTHTPKITHQTGTVDHEDLSWVEMIKWTGILAG